MKKFRCLDCQRVVESNTTKKVKCKQCGSINMIEIVEEDFIKKDKPKQNVHLPKSRRTAVQTLLENDYSPCLNLNGEVQGDNNEFQSFLINGSVVFGKRTKDRLFESEIRNWFKRGYR